MNYALKCFLVGLVIGLALAFAKYALASGAIWVATEPIQFFDDFNRVELGEAWLSPNGNYSIVNNQLVESTTTRNTDTQIIYSTLTTASDQIAKLHLVTKNNHGFGFVFRSGDSTGFHYEVHNPSGSTEWRWEINEWSAYQGRVGTCSGDQANADGDWLGARVMGAGSLTKVDVWRWDEDPGSFPNWGPSDCQMTQDPATAVDDGRVFGIRAYTGNGGAAGVVDDWSGGNAPFMPDTVAEIIGFTGQFQCRVGIDPYLTEEEVAAAPPASYQLFRSDTAVEDSPWPLACENVGEADPTAPVDMRFKNSWTRKYPNPTVNAVAYSEPDCQGEASTPSLNVCRLEYIWLGAHWHFPF